MAKLRGLLELMDEALNMDAAYEGVKRLGLKEGNTAADRAKALGFDTNVYHGSLKNFTEFNPSTSDIEGHLGKSIYTTDNPLDASRNYANLSAPDITAKAARDVNNAYDNKIKSHKIISDVRLKRIKKLRALKNPETKAKQELKDLLRKEAREKEFLSDKKQWVDKFKDNEGVVYPLAIRKGNQLDVTWNTKDDIDFNPVWDDAGENIIKENENLTNLHDSLYRQANKYNFNYDSALSQLDDFVDYYPANVLDNNLRRNSALLDAVDVNDMQVQNEIRRKIYDDMGYDSVKINANDNFGQLMNGIDNTNHHMIFNPANIRSIFAKFNPRLAGVGAGSVMSADLLADENGLLSSPDRNSILGYMADSYKYMADEGGLLGNILYSGGGKALDNLSYGTTPMKKGSGRLPSTPTNESLLNLMELFQL